MASDWSLQVWFCSTICPVADIPRTRRLPSVGNGHCNSCQKVVLIGGETSSRCSTCLRFQVKASILANSKFCSCACTCYESATRPAGDVPNSDGLSEDNDAGEEDAYSPPSTPSSAGSKSSSSSQEHTLFPQEAQNLHRGLTFWELHDLEAEGVPRSRLMEQFPEIEAVHGIRRPEVPSTPIPQYCHDCKRPRLDELSEAVSRGMVKSCQSCLLPLLSPDHELPSPEDLQKCRCRCVCCEYTDDHVEECWLPFKPNIPSWMPAQWVLTELKKRGFCIQDMCKDTGYCSVCDDLNHPNLSQVRAGTWQEYCRQREAEISTFYGAYLEAPKFPNGIAKDRTTGSGLPYALESYFLSIDPDAFGVLPDGQAGHVAVQRASHDVLENIFQRPRTIADDTRRISELHCWLSQNEYLLEEDDAESWCTCDELEIERDAYVDHLVNDQNAGRVLGALELHDYRHLYRRYERIAELRAYETTSDDLDAVVSAEVGYREYMTVGESQSDIPAVDVFPFLQGGATEALFPRGREQLLDVASDTLQELRDRLDESFDEVQDRLRVVPIGVVGSGTHGLNEGEMRVDEDWTSRPSDGVSPERAREIQDQFDRFFGPR